MPSLGREHRAGADDVPPKPKDIHRPYDKGNAVPSLLRDEARRAKAKAQLEADYADLRTRSPGGRG